MENITKVQFEKFVALQKSGKINMFDSVNGSKLIKESEDTYKTIVKNYGKLKNKFQ